MAHAPILLHTVRTLTGWSILFLIGTALPSKLVNVRCLDVVYTLAAHVAALVTLLYWTVVLFLDLRLIDRQGRSTVGVWECVVHLLPGIVMWFHSYRTTTLSLRHKQLAMVCFQLVLQVLVFGIGHLYGYAYPFMDTMSFAEWCQLSVAMLAVNMLCVSSSSAAFANRSNRS